MKKAAGAFNKVRTRFSSGERTFLLKPAGQTSKLTIVAEITTDCLVRWNTYREQMQFKLANNDASRLDQIAQASHIGHGVPNEANEIEVFAISNDQRDRIPPMGTSIFWKLFGVRNPKRPFAIP